MAKKIRKKTLSLDSYLEKIVEEDISDNQDVQRLFCWENGMINELIKTVLTDDYIPPIILGEEDLEEDVVQQYIVDGMQRSSALVKFKYENYKITSSLEDPIIQYQRKKKDENNKVCKDEYGKVVWESIEYDLRRKTYEMLPPELKKMFDDYQIDITIHQHCTMSQISKLVRRYNNHLGMNTSQKAFTYIDLYARKIRTISEENKFFKNCISCSGKQESKGVRERLVCESVMTTFFFENWKSAIKNMSKFLNENATEDQFNAVDEYLSRIEEVCKDRFTEVFLPKNVIVWIPVFKEFTKYGLEDVRFKEFVEEFEGSLHEKDVDGVTFDELNEDRHPKAKSVLKSKIDTLIYLMKEYLHIEKDEESFIDVKENNVIEDVCTEHDTLEFIKENVKEDVIDEDVEIYKISLNDWVKKLQKDKKIDGSSKLLEPKNMNSLLAVVAYSFETNIDLEIPEWMVSFFERNDTYIKDQKENYTYMVNDLSEFLRHKYELVG